MELKSVLDDETLALNTYRHDVSQLIPKATRIAWSLKEKEIQEDEPSATRRRFLYNLSRAEFEKEWGPNYERPSREERFYAFLYKLLPKIGPLKVLQLKTPTPETEKMFEESFNAAAREYRRLLAEERRGTLQLPNVNFDVGKETVGGKYRLNDDAHAQLLHKLAGKQFACISPELRGELLDFFASAEAPYDVKKDKKTWDRVQTELRALRASASVTSPAVSSPASTPPGVNPSAD